jgi:hypothetical protein
MAANGFGLETTTTLSAGIVWTPLTNSVAVQGESCVVTNALNAPAVFDRLCKP